MYDIEQYVRHGEYMPVSAVSPEVAGGINDLRQEAQGVLDSRKSQLMQGDQHEFPLAIDALSTADHVIGVQEDSYAYAQAKAALVLDCTRLLKEWNRKLKPEYFGELRHHYNQAEEEFYSHGLAVGQMTHNALTPIPGSPEEEARRINERVEDRTPIVIQKLGNFALGACGIRTISECTDKAITDYESDMSSGRPHSGYDGYVPEVEKVMIRDIRIDPITGDRLQEQVGLVGKYSITHEVIVEALRRRGVDASHMTKTDLHGTQLLVGDSLKDFVKLLDQVAAEDWCVPIFMGERVDEHHPMDYDAFWVEADERESELTEPAEVVAEFIVDLASDPSFDRRQAAAHVESFVKQLLLERSVRDTTLAEHAFGEKTAASIREYNTLMSIGNMDAAISMMRDIVAEAPGGGYCSGGSCGLESVFLSGKEGKEITEKLEAKSGDTIVRDTERSCPGCRKKGTLSYAYTTQRVHTYCSGCKTLVKRTTTGGK